MTRTTNKYRFSITLLFYNEEENVIPVVTSLKDILTRAGIDFQLVLVNNGSTDNTSSFIRELVEADTRLKEVVVNKNIGYGWGVIRGLKAADGEWIGYMDGDAQIGAEDVKRFLKNTTPEYDIVKVRRRKRLDGFIRTRISETFIIFFSILFGIQIYDINAKPVIFRRNLLEKFLLTSKDWFIDAELLLKAIYLNLRIREVPVIFLKRNAGRSSVTVSTIFEFLKNIFRFRFGKELKKWKRKIQLKS